MNAKEAMAARAVWAFMQDDIVGVNMVNNLEDHVNHAVTIASVTRSNNEAIDLADNKRMRLPTQEPIERRGRKSR